MVSSTCTSVVRPRGLTRALVLTLVLVGGAFAAAQDVPQLHRRPSGRRPASRGIDGRVDETVWSLAEAFSTFTQQEPDDGAPATERTELRFLVDRGTCTSASSITTRRPTRSSSARAAAMPTSPTPTPCGSSSIPSTTGRTPSSSAPIRSGSRTTGRSWREGQTAGSWRLRRRWIAGGTARAAFNPNWDADWTVRAHITDSRLGSRVRHSTEYPAVQPGDGRDWGVDVMRNIRRKNEQAYLARVPRGYTLQRVSVAGKLNGLSLPARREVKLTPYASGRATTTGQCPPI